MSDFRLELDSDGIRELLQDEDIAAAVDEAVNARKGRLTGKYVLTRQTGNRYVVRIETYDRKTFFKNLKTNELLKAFS